MKPLKFWPVGRYPILLIVLFVVFMLVIPVLSAKTHDSAQVPLVLGTFAVIGLILGMFLLSLFNLFFFKAWSRKFWYVNNPLLFLSSGLIIYFLIRMVFFF
ncbi:hypothetical protein B0O44_108198 [Pedobacter nutrimenti]|jgi:hypothetical protein|uniref:Uncharacterized protein n=1 Tax=Pedobacter nutrimenti TaxID=1241337 RepID=A0A318U930_9SPHI|nr:hypothetical protein B0O44_108198 [Pedobacter nutrimenti]